MLSITSTLVAQRFFNNDTGFGLMRYNSDGSIDSSFGKNGESSRREGVPS
jgi:hypothetical protein